MDGFIKLSRKLLKWEWKDDPNTMALWINILLNANWEDRSWHGKSYERGSFPTSIGKLARETGLTIQQTRTCLNRLKSTNEITIESTNVGTKIKVVKWAEYQCYDDNSNKRFNTPSNNQSTNDQQTANNTIRNIRNKELKNIYNSVPVYDPSINETMSKEEEEELLELMKGRA